MSSRLLYLIPLGAVIIGWCFFGAIFLTRRKYADGRSERASAGSMIGVLLQSVAYAVEWSVARRPFTAILPMPNWAEALVALLIISIVIGSLMMMWHAVRTLGRQWSLQARVLEEHALVMTGPYGVVRHPIYTGMLGMLVAAGLAFSQPGGLLVALVVFWIGTVIRVRSEEHLLREKFGETYAKYAAKVPALIPWRGRPAAN